jgi:ABC-type uncharacterized transport system auxiliary subunit
MHRKHLLTAVLVLALLAAALLQGCGSAKVHSRDYYTLFYALTDQERLHPQPAHPQVLRVRDFTVELAYDRQEIVYRYSPYQLEFYNYHQWVTKPQKMLTEMCWRHLRHANVFRDVTRSLKETLPEYELEATVQNIEEFDSDPEWYAHLAMTFRLIDYKTRAVVWHYSFDERRKVHNQSVVYVVRALSQILEERMGVVVGQLDTFLTGLQGAP